MTTIDFSKCFFCQSDDTGDLRDPTKSHKSSVYTLYQNVVQNIIQLKQLNEYPFDIDFQAFEVGEDGLEQAHVNSLERNGAVWHKSCRNKIDNQKVKRAKKKADKAIHTSPRKTRRMSLPCDGNSSFTSTSQNSDDGQGQMIQCPKNCASFVINLGARKLISTKLQHLVLTTKFESVLKLFAIKT
ncbi:hypothetical protein RRG08_005714 [Elysia crispata]|uniref:Uncharacterized protein n=1 Tax=Elysia crispata TaxID=231223 RepID=A0AAE0YDH3_9GAST|nr:hypothetical protein RRG08_005714 [Elysia crispata]